MMVRYLIQHSDRTNMMMIVLYSLRPGKVVRVTVLQKKPRRNSDRTRSPSSPSTTPLVQLHRSPVTLATPRSSTRPRRHDPQLHHAAPPRRTTPATPHSGSGAPSFSDELRRLPPPLLPPSSSSASSPATSSNEPREPCHEP